MESTEAQRVKRGCHHGSVLFLLILVTVLYVGDDQFGLSKLKELKGFSVLSASVKRSIDKKKNGNFVFNYSKLSHDTTQHCHRVKPGAAEPDVGYPEVLTKRSFSNKIRFVFFMGLEGTGHHLMTSIARACPNCLCPPRVDGFHASSHAMLNGFFGTRSTIEEVKQNAENLIQNLPGALQIHEEKNLKNESRTFILNTYCMDNVWSIGEMSYPNYLSDCRNQSIPDVRLFAELFETLGYDFRVVVLLRDVAELLHSNFRRGFSGFRELPMYTSILEDDMIESQLMRLDPRFYRCLDYDELPYVPSELGKFLNIDNQNGDKWTLFQHMKTAFKAKHTDVIAHDRTDFLKKDINHLHLKLEYAMSRLRDICSRVESLHALPKMNWCRNAVLHHGFIPLLNNYEDSNLIQRWKKFQCGDIFCDNVDQSQCHWNQFAIRSLIPDGQDRELMCDSSTVASFIMPQKWAYYQFNDLFKGKWLEGKPNSTSAWREIFPAENTLFGEYHRRAVAKNIGWQNYNLLYTVVSEFSKNITPPPLDAMVVHMRLGDVIDSSRNSVSDLLLRQQYFYNAEAEWDAYVRPLRHYSSLPFIPHIILLGGVHYGQTMKEPNATKSCLYVRAIQKYFEARGSKVTLRLGYPPDDDVLFASQSEMFAQAGGGFSRTIAEMVKRRGGKVFYPKYDPNP